MCASGFLYRYFFRQGSIQENLAHALGYMLRIFYRNVILCTPPLSGQGKAIPALWNAGIDFKSIHAGADSKHVMRCGIVSPAAGSSLKGMSGPSKSGVIFSHNKLTVGIRLRLTDLDLIILIVRTKSVVKFHGTLSAA